ncbi:uncharacterized protein LOC129590590 [Paramacrobiotus metropolitanus]|uniref:uncharacterized protein LOC129590590 n=1 Tax=Paramacrobiotus metropolitanus TaxID=2943436 RepID=UPI0024458927|nr:uncharacterized protein LOC129590590 [Paramacrobiotus metropolitanus]
MLLFAWMMGAQSSQLSSSISSMADNLYHRAQHCGHAAQARLCSWRKSDSSTSACDSEKQYTQRRISNLAEEKFSKNLSQLLCDRTKRSQSADVSQRQSISKSADVTQCDSVRSPTRSTESRRRKTASSSKCYNPPKITSDVVGQVRYALFRELADLYSRGSADAATLILGLNNDLIRQIIHSVLLANEPINSAVSRLIRVLRERGPPRRNVAGTSSVGVVHVRCPKQHDQRIIGIFARKLAGFAEMFTAERAISLALLQIETAFKEDTKAVDLVVDFGNFPCEGCGMEVVRKLLAELAQYKGFCERVFFVEFPEEYKGQCEEWKALPREFRRKVWCVTEENLQFVLPDYYQRLARNECMTGEQSADSRSCVSNTIERQAAKEARRKSVKNYFETTDRYLVITQLNRTELSTVSFTVRNISSEAFLVCHFVPKRPAYTIRPSAVFLLPYPAAQEFIIRTQDESPQIGDTIALHIYVLHSQSVGRIANGCDATAIRQFIEREKGEVILKCTCDLIVSKIEVTNSMHSMNDTDAQLFDSKPVPVDSTESVGRPQAISSGSSSDSHVTCLNKDFVDISEAVEQYNYARGDRWAQRKPKTYRQRMSRSVKSVAAAEVSQCQLTSQSLEECQQDSGHIVEEVSCANNTFEPVTGNDACQMTRDTCEPAEVGDKMPCVVTNKTLNEALPECCENESQTDTTQKHCTEVQCPSDIWDRTDACCDTSQPCEIAATQTALEDCYELENTECHGAVEEASLAATEEPCVGQREPPECTEELTATAPEACPEDEFSPLTNNLDAEPLLMTDAPLDFLSPPTEPRLAQRFDPVASGAEGEASAQIPGFVKWFAVLTLLLLLYLLYRQRKLTPVTAADELRAPELWSLRPSKRGLRETKPSITVTKPWLQFWPFHCTDGGKCWGGFLSGSFPHAQQCSALLEPVRSYCAEGQDKGTLAYWACQLAAQVDGEQCRK